MAGLTRRAAVRWSVAAVLAVTGRVPHGGAADALPWFDGDRPNAQAREAIGLLAAAAEHGLEPGDYVAGVLQQAILVGPQSASARAATARLLTAAMQRYLADLDHGRIDPRSIHADYAPPRRTGFDAAAALQAALAAGRLAEAARAAAPPLAQYDRLRGVLAQYRALSGHPAWGQGLPPLPAAPPGSGAREPRLEPGQAWAGLPLLAERLQALGDLPSSWPLAARFEGELVDAVRSFQQRHGLGVDGVVGAATRKQLDVAPRARARQIELTLERLRWTPLAQAPRMIAVNLPEFVLRAYEVRDRGIRVEHTMRVVVGRAMHTRTPVFDEDMRFVEFSPYWNVPPSIARHELVPQLRRDPDRFETEGFEFVFRGGRVERTLAAAHLDAVLGGEARLRQRPGPRNALGGVKFVFPNRANVYLHDTPSTRLFGRERRDFSHGCIRVEQPLALARFVLRDQPEWTEARIRAAMAAGESVTLRLARPVPVLIAYATAVVKDGRIHFFDDLYGHDRLLDAALSQPRAPLLTSN
jgi:murein L,D-transpeptidase YcbB/YkuD